MTVLEIVRRQIELTFRKLRLQPRDFEITDDKIKIITINRRSDAKSVQLDFTKENLYDVSFGRSKWLTKLEFIFVASFANYSNQNIDPIEEIEEDINIDPAVKTKWIVTFKENHCCKSHGHSLPDCIKVNCVYGVCNGVCCTATKDELSQCVCDCDHIESFYPDTVVEIEPNFEARVLSKPQLARAAANRAQPFINRIGANHSSQKSGDGTGDVNRSDINVFVVDTGIAAHSDLDIFSGVNFTSSDPNAWLDGHGHGTHVAGIIAGRDNAYGIVGVAPGVKLWAIKVLSDNGRGTASGIISALDWILNNRGKLWTGYGVVNMSLGGRAHTPIDTAVRKLISNGIIVVAAAGNSAVNAAYFSPARVPDAITVGATSPNPHYNSFAYYSNYGQLVDILAPGTNIYSTYKNNRYAMLSGTSMACPVVTGTVALLLSTQNVDKPVDSTVSSAVRNLLLHASTSHSRLNYDGTTHLNPRIKLSYKASIYKTTDISVRAGSF